MLRRLILAASLFVSLAAPALAQAPPAVPALPDSERRTSYTLAGTNCSCAVNFALFGDGTDYQDWVEVFINGAAVAYNDSTFGWTITSPTGPLATIPRPITDAVLTFNNTVTGTVQIVGARRPRQLSQFTEGRGVPARDLNQRLTDITAIEREIWDKTNDLTGRGLFFAPGNTTGPMPTPANCANKVLGFDSTGLNPVCSTGGGGGGGSGTVTSVGLALPNIFSISGSPVTVAGTLTGSLATQSANTGFFGPTTGSAAAPTFRAMVAADLGSLVAPIANGGTASTTAAGARSSSGLNIDEYTGHGDSNYNIQATDRVVATSATLTAARTWTLPAASALNAGQYLLVSDFAGGVTSSNTITIARAGSDTINGGTSVSISGANGAYLLVSDGVSKWTAQLFGTVQGLVIVSGKTLTINNTLTFQGTDGTTFTFPGSSDTVDTLAATQTISGNKTFSGTFNCTGTCELSGTAFGTFATQNYATPPAIGGTTPNTGAFTQVTATTPIGVASGGTNAANAIGARSSTGLNIENLTPHGDSNYTIVATDRTVGTSATLTTARTWTLPAASAVNPGTRLIVQDFVGGVSNTNTLTVQRAGSDTLNGSSTSVTINTGGGGYLFISNGVSNWAAQVIGAQAVSGVSSVNSVTGAVNVNGGTGISVGTSGSNITITNIATCQNGLATVTGGCAIGLEDLPFPYNDANNRVLAPDCTWQGRQKILQPANGFVYNIQLPSVQWVQTNCTGGTLEFSMENNTPGAGVTSWDGTRICFQAYMVNQNTNASTAIGNNVLHFASNNPTWFVGMPVKSNSPGIPANTTITAISGGDVTISNNVANQAITNGQEIQIGNDSIDGNYNIGGDAETNFSFCTVGDQAVTLQSDPVALSGAGAGGGNWNTRTQGPHYQQASPNAPLSISTTITSASMTPLTNFTMQASQMRETCSSREDVEVQFAIGSTTSNDFAACTLSQGGAGSWTIATAGSGLNNGQYCGVLMNPTGGSVGFGAAVNITVAGGVTSAITYASTSLCPAIPTVQPQKGGINYKSTDAAGSYTVPIGEIGGGGGVAPTFTVASILNVETSTNGLAQSGTLIGGATPTPTSMRLHYREPGQCFSGTLRPSQWQVLCRSSAGGTLQAGTVNGNASSTIFDIKMFGVK